MNGVRSGSEIGFVTSVRVKSQVSKILARKRDVKPWGADARPSVVPQNRHGVQKRTYAKPA